MDAHINNANATMTNTPSTSATSALDTIYRVNSPTFKRFMRTQPPPQHTEPVDTDASLTRRASTRSRVRFNVHANTHGHDTIDVWTFARAIGALLFIFVVTALCVVKLGNDMPSLDSPSVGFETKNTAIQSRATAYTLLLETARRKKLTTDPLKHMVEMEYRKEMEKARKANRKKHAHQGKHRHKRASRYDDDEFAPLSSMETFDRHVCGSPMNEYSRVLIASRLKLLSRHAILELCQFQHNIYANDDFQRLCERNAVLDASGLGYRDRSSCCSFWSLPSYVARLGNLTSCMEIQEKHVDALIEMAEKCASYFMSYKLDSNCYETQRCNAPSMCTIDNIAWNFFVFLVGSDMITTTPAESITPEMVTELLNSLRLTTIVFPTALSEQMEPIYDALGSLSANLTNIEVIGVDFGVRDAIFDREMLADVKLLAIAIVIIFVCVVIYVKSLFISLMSFVGIVIAFVWACFIYKFLLNIHFFPFINVLVVLILIATGTDNVFLLTKIYLLKRSDWNTLNERDKMIAATFHDATLPMVMSAFTSAIAFLSTAYTNVPSICCFGVFAAITIMCKLVIDMTFLRFVYTLNLAFDAALESNRYRAIVVTNRVINYVSDTINKYAWDAHIFDKFVRNVIVNNCVASLLLVFAIMGAVAIRFGMRVQDNDYFQMFEASNLFERYESIKNRYVFENRQFGMVANDPHAKMPARFIWGLQPAVEDLFNPHAHAHLQFDHTFRMTPAAARFLLTFCHAIRQQSWYSQDASSGPQLRNCIVENFRLETLAHECKERMRVKIAANCCTEAAFPFAQEIWDACLPEYLMELADTPMMFTYPQTAGLYYSLDEPPRAKALVVEFASIYNRTFSYAAIERFHTEIEAFLRAEMPNAPRELRNVMFTTDANMYDLQATIYRSSVSSVAITMAVTFLVCKFFVRRMNVTFACVVTLTCVITFAFGVFVAMGWRVGVVESVIVCSTVGLAADLTLHYAFTFCDARERHVDALMHTLRVVAGPSFFASVTTMVAGAMLLLSDLHAYNQTGWFLLVVMGGSWLYATGFLCVCLRACVSSARAEPLIVRRGSERDSLDEDSDVYVEIGGTHVEMDGTHVGMDGPHVELRNMETSEL